MKFQGIHLEAHRDLHSQRLLLRSRVGRGRVATLTPERLGPATAAAYLEWFISIARHDLAAELVEERQRAGVPCHQLVDLRAIEPRARA